MRRVRFVGVAFVVFAIAAAIIAGVLFSALWNGLMPGIFGLPAITFWQGLGLLLLSRLLFGRLGGWGNRMRKARFARGWNSLTPDERQRFRCAMHPSDPADPPAQQA